MSFFLDDRENLKVINIVALVVSIVVGIVIIFGSFYTVQSGTRALVLRFGEVQSIQKDGLHIKMPIIDSVIKVDIRTQKAHTPAAAGTKDLQNVATEVALNYHLSPDLLIDTYSRVGLTVEEKIIAPRIQETVKAVMAKFSAEELLTKRDNVKSDIALALRGDLIKYNIIMEDIQVTNFNFSTAFDTAIEAKQTAEQGALKAKNDLERVKVEAQQKIAMAEAEAKTIQIQAQAIKAQGGEEYVRLKAIDKWNGQLPQVTSGATPFIDMRKLQ